MRPGTTSFGPGSTVLVGGRGNDTLLGGNGRDVLIGGAGADDILVTGHTLLDTDLAGLVLVRLEWTSARSFPDRVPDLSGSATTGVNGSELLTATEPDRVRRRLDRFPGR